MIQAPLNIATILIVVAAVAAFIFVPYIRKVAEWFVTIIHEIGHGVFSLITGGGISGISLHSDGSGATMTTHQRGIFTWITRRIVLFAGYTTPIYLGVLMVILFMSGQSQLAYNILIGVGVLTVFFLRNIFGFVIMFVYFLAIAAVFIFSSSTITAIPIFVLFMAVLFIVRGFYDLIGAGIMVFKHSDNIDIQTDFHILQDEGMIYVPARAWYIIYVVLNVGMIVGACILFL